LTPAPISVFFADLPTNDFNQLFLNLFAGGSGIFDGMRVFPAAIGGSAYKPVVAPRSVCLATSFNMLGWLDQKPDAALPNFIGPAGPSARNPRGSVTDREREPFRLQAAEDMRSFYQARAQELVPHGKLLVQVFGRDQSCSTADGIYDVLSDALLDVIEQGKLPKSFYEDLVFPVYFRTLPELLAPIEEDRALAAAFRIEKAETRESIVGFNAERTRTGDVAAWARSYTGFVRAVTETVIRAAMPEGIDIPKTLEEVYRRMETRLVEDPERYEFRYISVGALLSRK
jgi:hypothetical protein